MKHRVRVTLATEIELETEIEVAEDDDPEDLTEEEIFNLKDSIGMIETDEMIRNARIEHVEDLGPVDEPDSSQLKLI